MNSIGKLLAFILGLVSAGFLKSFLDNKQVIILDKEDGIFEKEDYEEEQVDIIKLRPQNLNSAMDLRGTPTHVCPCGCEIWNLKVIFDNFEIGTYFLDMECANCGSLATAPTPVDRQGTGQDS